jgi:hypothetical protein
MLRLPMSQSLHSSQQISVLLQSVGHADCKCKSNARIRPRASASRQRRPWSQVQPSLLRLATPAAKCVVKWSSENAVVMVGAGVNVTCAAAARSHSTPQLYINANKDCIVSHSIAKFVHLR